MGGIFTGCKTSANHKIWERILQITGDYYESKWSGPGFVSSPFIFCKDGKYYYDEDCTILYNYLAKMSSSLYTNEDGSAKMRSWCDVLYGQGYKITHDTMYPSRSDGMARSIMSIQLIYNATFRNTAKEFIPDAENVLDNPDGYTGNCRIEIENSNRVLVTDGTTEYLH